jgi:hypothetical protein
MQLASVVLVVVSLPAAIAASRVQLQGRVIGASNSPISDVRVTSLPWDDTHTDSSGRFSLAHPADLVRFSKPGYRPVTKPVSALTADVVLEPSDQAPWAPGVCQGSSRKRFGDTMTFLVPPGHPLRTSQDVDNLTVWVGYRGRWLQFGTGPHWSNGLPVAETLSAMVSVQERDIETPWGDPASEYRGIRKDGAHWRYIGMFGQSISYDMADALAAQYFDTIMDSLCFKRQTYRHRLTHISPVTGQLDARHASGTHASGRRSTSPRTLGRALYHEARSVHS